ncbi:MAG: mechanosensitive ion channel domain-containing protein [Ginsengibacter sp.]
MKELKQQFENFLHNQHIADSVIPYLVFLVLLIISGILVFVCVFVTKKILDNVVGRIFMKTHGKWDDLLIKHRLFSATGYLVSVIVLKAAVPALFEDFPRTLEFIGKLLDVYLVFVIITILIVFLKATEEYLSDSELFIEKPISSYFQLIRLVLYIIAAILGLSIILTKSPIYLLGAFGAMTAVLLLIFKDTILGLVASIQISANDMVRIGDWVEMPKYHADGDVTAINLNTVKVMNWDKTITTVPTYYFITESFKNWRGMQMSGGRRIKRTIQISIGSIRFVDTEMKDRFKKIDLIRKAIVERQAEIEQYNRENDTNLDVLINGRRMTNVGVFRMYIEKYLQNHSGINQDMTMLVRQQAPGEHGLPIEIYCFTNTIKWAEYENIQSDIFDHLVASVTYFDLVIFQSPSGKDFRELGVERRG